MSDDLLSQSEIDALMGKNIEESTETEENQLETEVEETKDSSFSQDSKDESTDEASIESGQVDDTTKDIIGEIGNISMSTAATALSTLLNHKVTITTPRVSCVPLRQIIEESAIPKVVTSIKFKEGLTGDNLLMMDVKDSMVIADLMMGGDGKDAEKGEFTELELSAVGEAMNQMIGSASTSMATMLGKTIDIMPPKVDVWDKVEEIDLEAMDLDVGLDSYIMKVAFDLEVPGLIESEIMQIFTADSVKDIVDTVMGEIGDGSQKVGASSESTKPAVEEKPQAPVTPPEPEPEPEVQPQAQVQEEPAEPAQQEYVQQQYMDQQEPEQRAPKQAEADVSVKKPVFPELGNGQTMTMPSNLDLIMDVPLDFSVVLGSSKKTIREVLDFTNGSIVELNKLADEPLDIYVNGKLIAEGEVVVINENFGIRITNILTKKERIQNLR